MSKKSIDKVFLGIVVTLTLVGVLVFTSASFSLLAKQGAKFSSVAFNQIVFGLVGGSLAAYIISRIHFVHYKKYSLFLFLGSLVLTCLVFVPGIGWGHGGARRWIAFAGHTFQPSELLKIATILYAATVFSNLKEKIQTFRYGVVAFLAIVSVVGVIFFLQPDTDTLAVLVAALFAMFFSAGARFRHLALLFCISLVALGGLVMMKPYIKDRLMTFIDPSKNSLDSGYQIQQSLIAIGSGGLTGRGFGQSLQKFNFLPEAMSDSIFAVASEEFGFVGSVIIILLFVGFAGRGLKIAVESKDSFGRLVVVGIVILITAQSLMNIAAMLAVIPLSGQPLLFMSQGGTALLFTLMAVGIVFNISKYQKIQ